MKNKTHKIKENLVCMTLEDLGKHYTPGLYAMLDEHYPELSNRFNASEAKIHRLVHSGNVKDLKKALEGYWYLHMELIGRAEKIKKVG